jgi:GT2 family glycosyltransferase
MKLSIIVVNFNGGKVLGTCFSSVFRETRDILFEVILVDNNSTDGSVEAVEQDFPAVRIIRNGENRGFAAANNIAIREAAGEFILLLNPDTEILDGAIQKTVAFMDSKPEIGVAGCKLLYADRTVQPSVRGYPSVLSAFLDATFLHLLVPRTRIVRGKGVARFDDSLAQEVDWVIGAYFMFRKSMAHTIGLLDEQFWIFGEEIDYCRRAKNAGFDTWYFPGAAVVHFWGGMTAYNLRVIVWLHIGVKLYTDKHFRGARRFVIIYLRYLGAAVRLVGYPVAACLSWDKRLLTKAYYYGVALGTLLTHRVRYTPGYAGRVIPWTELVGRKAKG